VDGWGFFALFFLLLAYFAACLSVRCFELRLAVVVVVGGIGIVLIKEEEEEEEEGVSMISCDGRCLSCALALSWSVVYLLLCTFGVSFFSLFFFLFSPSKRFVLRAFWLSFFPAAGIILNRKSDNYPSPARWYDRMCVFPRHGELRHLG